MVHVVCYGWVKDQANHLLLSGEFLVGTDQALLEFGHVSIHNCCEVRTGQKEVCHGLWTILAEGEVLLVIHSRCAALVKQISLGQHLHFGCCLDHS